MPGARAAVEIDVAVDAAVGERAIGVGQREQRDVGAAERQRRAVVAAAFRQRQAERIEAREERIGAEHRADAHGRHVQARAQRRARADPAFEVAVVVLRQVQAARGGELRRRIVEERGGRDEPLLEGELVDEGLQRRAGLAAGENAVDLRRARQVAGRADPGENLAARVVEHEHGAVFDVAAAQSSASWLRNASIATRCTRASSVVRITRVPVGSDGA